MATVYVREQGAVVCKRRERLRVVKDGQLLEEVPMIHVSQVVLVGEVQVTSQAMAMLLARGVDVLYCTPDYEAQGRVMRSGSKFAQLRSCQFQKRLDEKAVLMVARVMGEGKLGRLRLILEQQLDGVAGRGDKQKVRKAIGSLSRHLLKVRQAAGRQSLWALLRQAEADYLAVWPVLTQASRVYLPLLSFGTALLTKEVMGVVELVGLDPYLGFLHRGSDGDKVGQSGRAPALVLDFVYELRPIFVDRLVLDLLRGSQRDHFEVSSPGAGGSLSSKGQALFLRAYEGHLQQGVLYEKQMTSYRRVLELQVRQLARVVLGKQERYRGG